MLLNDPAAPQIHRGSVEAGTKVRVGANAAAAYAAMEDVKRQVQEMAIGNVNPDEVRRNLLRRYYKGLMHAAHPGASSVRGHRWAKVACRVNSVDIVIDWEYMPGQYGRPMILAFCPVCYWIAPMGARTADATRPVFIDNQLGRVPGNPESDKKFVAFQIQATNDREIYFDGDDRLCIDRLVECPQAKSICGWIIKISNGIASRQPRRIFRANEQMALTGPIIMASAAPISAPTGPIIMTPNAPGAGPTGPIIMTPNASISAPTGQTFSNLLHEPYLIGGTMPGDGEP